MIIQEIPDNFRKRYFLITVIAILVYLLTAILSEGYYHPDEHFQLLEFANFKRGLTATYKLPWEFREQIRPSFQPWIAYWIIRILHMIGIENPHIYILILRSLTAALSIYAINRFYQRNLKQIPQNYWTTYLLLSYFLWFLPFVNVRFSGETWSGILFLIAVSHIPLSDKLSYTTAAKVGIFCGLSFLCRFQSGVMFASLWAWLLFFRKSEIKPLIAGVAAYCIIILFGTLLDKQFYDTWTFTPLNYFNANIVDDVASRFGTMTWHHYLHVIMMESVLPIGIIIGCALVISLFIDPTSMVVWCIAPLLLIHLIVPHKEVRFMFPVVNFIPLLLILAAARLESFWSKIEFRKFILPLFAVFFSGLNIVALLTAMCSKSQFGRIAITCYIYDHFLNSSPNIYSLRGNDPFLPYSIIYQSFYQIPATKHIPLSSYSILTEKQFKNTPPGLLIIRRKDLQDLDFSNLLSVLHLKEAHTGNFRWVSSIKSFYYGSDYYDNEYVLYTLE